MTLQYKRKRHSLGFFYGAIAGFAFSVAAWGIDSVILASSHSSFAWIKFIPGFITATIVGGLVGWLSSKISKGCVTIPLWILFGACLVWLVIWLPLTSTPAMVKFLRPDLVDWIDYPEVQNLRQFQILSSIVILLPAIICGLLESNVVDTVLMSSHRGAIITVILACGFLMGLAGFAGDEIINKHFREPTRVLDDLMTFALEHQGEEVDDVVARRIHLSSVKGLEGILSRPRTITLIAYDELLAQMDFLVDFDGIWVKCTTIYAQPTMCEQILWAPIQNQYLFFFP
jgi:hypothetical protein